MTAIHPSLPQGIPAPQPSVGCRHPVKPYRPFFLTALFVMLVAGVGWGTALIVKLVAAGQYTALSLHEINAHGHAMLTGFVQLFIVGFAYQAFPRLLGHPLHRPSWCKPVLGLYVVGLLLSVGGQLLNQFPPSAWIALAGNCIETAAVLTFCWQILVTYRKGGVPFEPHLAFITAAMSFMVLSSAFSTWLDFATLRVESRMEAIYLVSTYQPALRYLQLHGIALIMILGVGHRLLTNFYAFPRTSDRWMLASIAILVGSVIAEAALFIAFRTTSDPKLAALLVVPWTGLVLGSAIVVARWRLWRRPRDGQGRTDRMAPFVQASFGWLAVAFFMTFALPLWSRLAGVYFSHSFYGASRQAFVFGFVTMMIVAFTLRIVPTLNGIVPTRLPSMRMAFWTLNVGCFLHVSSQVASDLWPAANFVLPAAAALELIGVVLWSAHLVWCIREGRTADAEPPPTPLARLNVLG